LRDAEGHEIPAKRFQHIASTSGYADELLLALSEPERIAALSQAGRRSGRELFRYGARPSIASPSQIEQLLSLHVDLLLVSSYGGRSDLSRLREAGIVVFDLGEQRGTRSLEPSIRAVATLLGDPARGERLWRGWSRQLDAVARDIPAQARKPAAYVAIYANKLYGGTRGTSYHDVLTAAGLQDLAADTYRDWPQYDPEQLLLLDPPLIVTEAGMAAQLCAHAWLRSLRACAGGQAGHQTGIVEVSQNLMGSAGLGMLDAALELRQLVYPSP
jgi:iron complex transport system substrate-binding protein